VLAAVALSRIVAWDAAEPLVLANVLSWYLYLPAWIVAPAAAVARRFALALVAFAVGGAQVGFVLPELTAARPLPSWVASAPRLGLLDANVYDGNLSMSGYSAQIRSDRPELVTMEEANPLDFAQLEQSGAFDRLPYRYEVDRFDPWAFVVASRFPLRATRVVSLFGRPLVVQTTLELPSGSLELWVVHTVAPLPSSWTQWSAQLAEIAGLLARRRTQRLLVVGDFNATWGNKGFRAILGTGMSDGAAARGDPFEMTWSQQMPPLPPFARIDHVLAASDVSVLSIRTGTGVGSDHRDVMATVAVRPARQRG
jgi:endonuclease/exonuclease/phosphatase (EEP) superfamily protein YafD